VVVVQQRVIVRSWNDKPGGWYRAFREHPQGHVQINDHDIPIRAIPVRSARLNDATDEGLRAKYTTKANAKYVRGFKTAKRKAATLELIPA
jgi:hypothetical protein